MNEEVVVVSYLWRLSNDENVVPGVVVEPDGVGLDGRVQLACAELHGERDAAVLEGQVHVVVPVACEGFLSFICNSK